MLYKLFVIFILLYVQTFSINSFIFIDEGTPEKIAEIDPDFTIGKVYALVGIILNNPSPDIIWAKQYKPYEKWHFLVTDISENDIIYTIEYGK